MLPSKIDQMKVSHETGSEALDENHCELWIWTCLDAFLGMRPPVFECSRNFNGLPMGGDLCESGEFIEITPPAVNH